MGVCGVLALLVLAPDRGGGNGASAATSAATLTPLAAFSLPPVERSAFVCSPEEAAAQVKRYSSFASACPGTQWWVALRAANLRCRELRLVNVGANKVSSELAQLRVEAVGRAAQRRRGASTNDSDSAGAPSPSGADGMDVRPSRRSGRPVGDRRSVRPSPRTPLPTHRYSSYFVVGLPLSVVAGLAAADARHFAQSAVEGVWQGASFVCGKRWRHVRRPPGGPPVAAARDRVPWRWHGRGAAARTARVRAAPWKRQHPPHVF